MSGTLGPLAALVTLLVRASGVTQQCSRVPTIANSLPCIGTLPCKSTLTKTKKLIFGAPRMPLTPRREVFAKFSRKFFENVGAKIFSKSRSRRRDQFGPKIVKIRAILAIFEPFEVLGCQKNRIFERPFTPRGWLRSASNFGKTRFRRSPTFHLSTSKNKIRQKILKKKFGGKIIWKTRLGYEQRIRFPGKGLRHRSGGHSSLNGPLTTPQ